MKTFEGHVENYKNKGNTFHLLELLSLLTVGFCNSTRSYYIIQVS
jgi:hypothetical protein